MASVPTTRSKRTLVLLPGFDGTGSLFTPLRKALDPSIRTEVISYSTDRSQDYDELCSQVLRELPKTPHVIVAESFSGPVALKAVTHRPKGLQALVLSTSFAVNPRPWISLPVRNLLGPWFFRIRPPIWTIRALLAGADASAELCKAVRDTVKTVSPQVLAFRFREVLRADATADLLQCPVPIFYLCGTRDRLLGKGAVRSLSAARPDATIINVQGPHLLLQTAPDVCAAHIETVVTGLDWHDG